MWTKMLISSRLFVFKAVAVLIESQPLNLHRDDQHLLAVLIHGETVCVCIIVTLNFSFLNSFSRLLYSFQKAKANFSIGLL